MEERIWQLGRMTLWMARTTIEGLGLGLQAVLAWDTMSHALSLLVGVHGAPAE